MKLNSTIGAIAMMMSLTSFGQVEQIDRFEIAINNDEISDFHTVSAGESGLMIYRRIFEPGVDKLEIIRIDTALHEVWKQQVEIAKDLVAVRSAVKDNILFILFRNAALRYGDFHIAAISVADGESVVYTVKNLIPFQPSEFVITNTAALIGGYFNYRPLIVYFNFDTQFSKILPGFFNEPGELTQIKTYDNGTTDVIVSTDNYDKKKCLWIRNYSDDGDIIKTTILQPEDKKNLIFGRSIKVDDEQLVVGVFGRFKEYSRGLFIARITPTGEYNIQYHDYADFEHFFNYMKATKEKRVMGRIERKKIKGKKAKFNYRFAVHEIVKAGDEFVMLGEAFYPQYAYPNGVMYRNGIPQMYSHSFNRGGYTLIGYHYTHAVVIGFDKKGNLTWDNSFEINDVTTPTLKQFVKIQPLDDKILLQYVYENRIRTKTIKDSEIVEGKSFDEIKLRFADDILRDEKTTASTLDYWYDGHLYVSGIQQIKNFREIKVSANRKVFFVNKINYK
ncbi:MAG: hypothetical protein R2820_15320 [Cyclobacteriaceae bacterium]